MSTRDRRTYDHRLRELVYRTQDSSAVAHLSIPRSTLDDRLRHAPRPVVSLDELDHEADELRSELARLRQRVSKLLVLLRLLVAVIKACGIDLNGRRLPEGHDKAILRAVDRSRKLMPIRVALRTIGLTASRFNAWRHSREDCELDDRSSCPRSSPHRLTIEETRTIREMACSDEYRHVPTATLAMLAQREGREFASPNTWHRLIKRFGWRRPRKRVHPSKPRDGIRATRPDELWHVDTTVIRLLDGTKAYLHAIIDNFSRRILAWKATGRFEVASTAILLNEAAQGRYGEKATPLLLVDQGVDNMNTGVDELIESGLIRRVLAQTDITFSNSMIEAWWRVLKHNWLYLNQLNSVATTRKLVAFYVQEHNSRLPHSAFGGQTPDEMYFGTGMGIAEDLKARRGEARNNRMQANRAAKLCRVPGRRGGGLTKNSRSRSPVEIGPQLRSSAPAGGRP